ncbi:MAG: ATP/GTP-binding protein, partial [Acidimicrobiales bacterium]
IDLPNVATAPPQGGLQLVGVDVWFWITNNKPASVTARVPGLAATITARPRRTRLHFDDGTTVDCAGSGTPYDPAVDYSRQTSDCTHIFQDPGRQAVDVTISWDLTWTATNGQAGTLPAVDRTTTVTLPLRQAQAVTD